ncbi:MAG: hypothetical protein AB7P99_02055 [Vicinamibacterales bacterium]
MVIRSSSAGEVERLVARLRSGDAVDREAAVARLRVIGARAASHLVPLVASPAEPPAARSAALRALDGSTDLAARDAAIGALADDGVAPAAIATLRPWLIRDDGVTVLEALTALALDVTRPADLRLAALDALSQLPADIVQPLRAAAPVPGGTEANVPGDPLELREWLGGQAGAPLSVLHDVVVEARERERREPSARRREHWLVTRGTAHAILARRGSRVALYDLKETFDAATGPLPIDFLAAITAIGDASCLEPMARAWAAAAPAERWWRDRLADAAADIMHRTRLSGRSAVVRRIRAKFSGFL